MTAQPEHPHSWCNIYGINGNFIECIYINDIWSGMFRVWPDGNGMYVVFLKRTVPARFDTVYGFRESHEYVSEFIQTATGNDLDSVRWGLTGTPFAQVEGSPPQTEPSGEAFFGFHWTPAWDEWLAKVREAERNERTRQN